VFVWNGLNANARNAVADARRFGSKVFYLEHGFFDRNRYCQADHAGILHRASWRQRILDGRPPPAGAAERLARFYPDGLAPMKGRGGYVLVLGQVTGDTQMLASDIKGAVQLEAAVAKALPKGVRAYFRPHPRCSNVTPHRVHKKLPRLEEARNETREYIETMHGSGLDSALAGAMFVVTINSNAITEALAAGVPCLAFGPSLGIDAGAVRPTTLATFAEDIDVMLGGWRPEPDRVRYYLEWLAARQWNIEEFRDPAVVGGLLEAAGVSAPVLEGACA